MTKPAVTALMAAALLSIGGRAENRRVELVKK